MSGRDNSPSLLIGCKMVSSPVTVTPADAGIIPLAYNQMDEASSRIPLIAVFLFDNNIPFDPNLPIHRTSCSSGNHSHGSITSMFLLGSLLVLNMKSSNFHSKRLELQNIHTNTWIMRENERRHN